MNTELSPIEPSAAGLPCIHVQLLGPPIVAWNDTILSISRRTVRALFYRLACELRPVAREHLHLLFWPDEPESVARRNLSHSLTHLRRSLPVPRILASSPERVWFDPDLFWCDAVELRQAASDPALEPSQIPPLINLYRGPFLEDFNLPDCSEFEHWCLVERFDLERQYLKLLGQLVERCSRQGEIQQAVHYARLYLETDHLAETMHQRLIQLYAASGERHLALQQFEHCAATLARELSVEPLPETRAIYLAVLSGQHRFPVQAIPTRTPSLSEVEVPLIGRDDELHILAEAFSRLDTDQNQVVLLSGEAGIGKTRLMDEFARSLQNRARILSSSGHACEQTIPYYPILEIVRSILNLPELASGDPTLQPDFEAASLDYLEPVWLTEVSRLLPEMNIHFPDLPPPLALEPESAQTRLFDAMSRLVLSYAKAHGPILLCLDDLQWMDAASKAWLAHISRYLKRGRNPLLILGTYRTEENEAILELRQSLVQDRVLIEVQLSRLDEQSVLLLVRAMIGARPGDELLAQQLHQATGGNPFYLIETLHKLIEEGRLQTDRKPDTGFQHSLQMVLPESVREAIQARLRLVSPVARQVLEAGSVLGQSFGIDLLRLTAGRSHHETITALEELTARVLLVEGSQEYRFIHELTRQHVAENIGKIRERLLHLRAARATLRLNSDAYLILAHHFELGGDLPKALHYHGLAAQRAQALFAWQEVEFHQERILELLASLDPTGANMQYISQQAEILGERAHTRYLLGRREARDADLQALSDLGEARQDDAIRLQAILNRIRYLNLDGDYAQAIALAERGLALLESSPTLTNDREIANPAKARLLAQIGFGYYFLGRPAEALNRLELAWGMCDETSDPDAYGRIMHILGYVYLHLGDYPRSLECQHSALTWHQELGDANRMAWDLIDIGILHMVQCDLDQARYFLDQGLDLSRRVGSQQAEAYGLAHTGKLELYLGEYAIAVERFQQVMEMLQTSPSEHVLATAEAGIGFAYYHLGDFTQSRPWLESALQRARTTGNRRRTAKTLIQLGMLETVEERLPQARWNLIEGLAVAQDCQSKECLASGLAALARLERLAGDPECALDIALEAINSARQAVSRCCEMWAEIEAGLDYLALKNMSAALEHTGRAVELAPQACKVWIRRDEAQRAYELVLQANAGG